MMISAFVFFARQLRNPTRWAPIGHHVTVNLLAAIGAFHIALLASLLAAMLFAASSLPASAQEAPVCTGQNLIALLEKEDPERLATIRQQASETVFGDTTLFRLEKEGAAPSWLFGTMHLTDPRVTSLSAQASEALANADTVAIETTDILDEVAAQMQLLANPEMTMFTDGSRLSDFLDSEEKAIVEKGLAERGMQLALVDRMKPWVLSGMLALPSCEMARKTAGQPILDNQIALSAQADGKALVGLETVMEQLSAMNSLPVDTHIDGLVETLRLGDTIDDVIETMIILYEDGQTGTIWPLLRSLSQELGDEPADENYQLFEEVMVDTRNKTMFERSLPLLEQGGAFIAVGALHLPGEKGLAKMFADAGYTVTPLRD